MRAINEKKPKKVIFFTLSPSSVKSLTTVFKKPFLTIVILNITIKLVDVTLQLRTQEDF